MTDISKMTSAMMQFAEMTKPLIDAAVGYSAQCEEAGFPKDLAQQMAAQYHNELVTFVFAAMSIKKASS